MSERLQTLNLVEENPKMVIEYTLTNFWAIANTEPKLLPKYLEHCAIVCKHKRLDQKFLSDTKRLYYDTGIVLIVPAIFNNPWLLSQYDKALITVYEADEVLFQRKPHWLSTSDVRYVSSYVNLSIVAH